MRDILGAAVLIAALFAFGMFDFKEEDALIDAGLLSAARQELGQTVHPVEITVDRRDITLRGHADSAGERAEIQERVARVEGRGSISNEVEVVARIEPFETVVTKGKIYTATGAIPTEAAREGLANLLDTPMDGLVLASGAPGREWGRALLIGAEALKQLENGRFTASGRNFRLEGTALTPLEGGQAERLLKQAPEGYSIDTDIAYRDDGSPLRLTAILAGGETRITAKLPDGLALPDGAEAAVTRSPLPPPVKGWATALEAGLAALGHLQSGQLTLIGKSLTLTGETWSADAYEAAEAALARLPSRIVATVDITQVDDGTPFTMQVEYDGARALSSGKVPADLGLRVQAAFADMPVVAGDLRQAAISAGPDWWQAATAGLAALKFLEHGRLEIKPGALQFSGLIFDPARRAEMQAALAADVPDGTEVTYDLTLHDDGHPFALHMVHDGNSVTAGGKWPGSLDADALSTAFGTPVAMGEVRTGKLEPPEGWLKVALAGAGALATLQNGALTFEGTSLRLAGAALDPQIGETLRKRLQLPEGYTLDLRVDGRPYYLTLTLDGQGARASGKLPPDLGLATQAIFLGQPIAKGDLSYTDTAASPEWWGAARAGIRALALLEAGTLTVDPQALALTGTARDASAKSRAEAQLKRLTEGFKLTVEIEGK